MNNEHCEPQHHLAMHFFVRARTLFFLFYICSFCSLLTLQKSFFFSVQKHFFVCFCSLLAIKLQKQKPSPVSGFLFQLLIVHLRWDPPLPPPTLPSSPSPSLYSHSFFICLLTVETFLSFYSLIVKSRPKVDSLLLGRKKRQSLQELRRESH